VCRRVEQVGSANCPGGQSSRHLDLHAVGRGWRVGGSELGSRCTAPEMLAGYGSWRASCPSAGELDIRQHLSLCCLLTPTTYTDSQQVSILLHLDTVANMQVAVPSPQRSRASSGNKSPLSLDLSDLPPLVEPSPPSNTLIITVCMTCHISTAVTNNSRTCSQLRSFTSPPSPSSAKPSTNMPRSTPGHHLSRSGG
jgi:hypothetical protein